VDSYKTRHYGDAHQTSMMDETGGLTLLFHF